MGKGKPHSRVLSRVTHMLGYRFPARHHILGLYSSPVELSLFNSWFGSQICLFHRCRREEIIIPGSDQNPCGFLWQLLNTTFGGSPAGGIWAVEGKAAWGSEPGRQSRGFAVPSSFNETVELEEVNLSREALWQGAGWGTEAVLILNAFLRRTRVNWKLSLYQ